MEKPVDDHGPLAGVKVVELSMYVQGPVAGLTLASLGADFEHLRWFDLPVESLG